jgi:hypothetical protein
VPPHRPYTIARRLHARTSNLATAVSVVNIKLVTVPFQPRPSLPYSVPVPNSVPVRQSSCYHHHKSYTPEVEMGTCPHLKQKLRPHVNPPSPHRLNVPPGVLITTGTSAAFIKSNGRLLFLFPAGVWRLTRKIPPSL